MGIIEAQRAPHPNRKHYKTLIESSATAAGETLIDRTQAPGTPTPVQSLNLQVRANRTSQLEKLRL